MTPMDVIFARLEEGPQQVRTRERLERVIEATTELLVDLGPELTSIPEIEKRAGVPRAAIYRYFPHKYALFSIMAAGHMDLLSQRILSEAASRERNGWREMLGSAIDATVSFYNDNPAACLLAFSGPFTAKDRAAHDRKTRSLVAAFRADVPPAITDEQLALMIEIAFACLRYGYLRDGTITDEIAGEAVRAATAYLESRAASDPFIAAGP